MSTRRQSAQEANVTINMGPSSNKRVNQVLKLPPPPPLNYDDSINDSDFPENHPEQSFRSKEESDVNSGKPRLPEFLQNMGPGLSPLKEHPPVTLSWHNVRVQAPSQQGFIKQKINGCLGKEIQGPKELVKGVSGIVKAGEMCAIMGASGAGKTTLLNVMTHRRQGKLEISADIRINGQKLKKDISGVSAFVQQEELFIGSLTVREHLRFHSMLRLGKEFTKDERNNRVDEVLHFLNLTKTENTTIGIGAVVKGLSGGEKRRLTFATEILSDPPLLFCDEPTSGLDSSMAFILVQAMRKLADQGKTIVCTIHQPSSEIFFLFDTLYLLAEGRLAYFGSLEKAPAYFRQFDLEIPRNYNPADFYIRQLAIYPRTREENLAQIELICDAYENSSQYARYQSEIIPLHSSNVEDEKHSFFLRLFQQWCGEDENNSSNDVNKTDKKQSRYKTGSMTQFRWLIWRNFVDLSKNPFEIRLRLILALFVGTLIGLLYFRLSYNQTAVQNFNALLFLTLINTSFANIFAITQSYTKEYPIFYKEHDDAVYRVTPYYLAKFTTELPMVAITTIIQITITYWISNLYGTAKRFFIFIGIIVLNSFAAVGLGSVISVLANSPEQAQAIQIPILLPLMVFGGFFLNNNSGQEWLNWIKYISWFYYGNEALIINQWADVDYLPCNMQSPNLPCYHNGDEVLQLVYFNKSHFGRDIGLLVVICRQTNIKSNQLESGPRHSLSATLLSDNRNTTIENNETCQILNSEKQTPKARDKNNSIVQQSSNIFHFNSLLTSSREPNERQMRNIDRFESTIQWGKALDREFQSLDIDADGYVSIADLQSVLKNFSHLCDSNEILLRIFKELDINDDKRISKEEFQLYKKILLEREKRFHRTSFEKKLTSIFALFDRNQDNYITRQEIRETMQNLGESIDDELLEEMMKTADTNHDDRISRDEFEKLLIELQSKK
ncbi:unnamed protein product [Rotaria socialis]|uniref:Uncharacterized protein n=2 Tax=Rotaria socialis TaxID=392032 RepID=A0A817UIM2_9BILA|nr:unnamed protein product [Rotaria socialis]